MTGQGDELDAALLAYNRGILRARRAYREGPVDWDQLEADEAAAQKSSALQRLHDQARGSSPSAASVALRRHAKDDAEPSASRSDRGPYGVTVETQTDTLGVTP